MENTLCAQRGPCLSPPSVFVPEAPQLDINASSLRRDFRRFAQRAWNVRETKRGKMVLDRAKTSPLNDRRRIEHEGSTSSMTRSHSRKSGARSERGRSCGGQRRGWRTSSAKCCVYCAWRLGRSRRGAGIAAAPIVTARMSSPDARRSAIAQHTCARVPLPLSPFRLPSALLHPLHPIMPGAQVPATTSQVLPSRDSPRSGDKRRWRIIALRRSIAEKAVAYRDNGRAGAPQRVHARAS